MRTLLMTLLTISMITLGSCGHFGGKKSCCKGKDKQAKCCGSKQCKTKKGDCKDKKQCDMKKKSACCDGKAKEGKCDKQCDMHKKMHGKKNNG